MQCPKCQTDNPEGSNFCVECGGKLERICLSCGGGNALSYKFCNKCGQDLRKPQKILSKDLSFQDKLEKIQKYLPQGLTERIISQIDRIEGERMQATVMVCDMQGHTPLSELRGIEHVYSIMNQVRIQYRIIIEEGTRLRVGLL